MADPAADARIRDLERRLDLDSGSRLFVSLAEEYRRVGRIKDALSALQKGLLAHPGYIAAQVALGRTYTEANMATDAIATFTKVLVADPANLVAAKSLAEIHLGRNDNLEALKKFKLYRAISGDRKVDEVIAKLEPLVAPKPVTPPRKAAEPPPPPPKFQETDKSRRRPLPKMPGSEPAPPLADAFELTSLSFEPGDDSGGMKSEDPFPFVPTRDVSLAAPAARPTGAPPEIPPPPPYDPRAEPPAPPPPPSFAVPSLDAPAASAPAPEPPSLPENLGPATPEPVHAVVALPTPPPPPPEAPPEAPAPEPVRPTGRALADLYYAQGHYAEALQIYDDLVTRHPFDEELKRLRRDAEARLLPAATTPAAAAPDVGLERRLSRIRALKQWLSLVQAG
ncbi:MAG TPA: tetratricopeptide repeat protein [Thermoanaerobaculia bacterium]|nr:tetratricopeptide repeat protein [Thermoanaerobaculia bacterium]